MICPLCIDVFHVDLLQFARPLSARSTFTRHHFTRPLPARSAFTRRALEESLKLSSYSAGMLENL